MASIRKEFRVATPIDRVWDALSDFHAVHTKLARGFVVASQPEEDGAVRAITFANGMKARERKVTVDPAAKRVVYAIQDSPSFTFYVGAAQLFEDDGGTLFVWQVDLLPDAMAAQVSRMMDAGLEAMRKTVG
jgi:carbon monoxide dehydrogenase subunit G